MIRALLVLALLVAMAGCASSPPPRQSDRGSSSSTRARCASNSSDLGLRIFILCAESP